MKMFRGLSNWIGMDMGSSQVRIYRENKVILAEASTVAVDNIDGHVLGFGTEALIHYHKAPENISLEWPVQNGVIADYDMTKAMLRFFIRKSLHHAVSRPTVMISIPGETSSVTRHALVDALIHAGAQHVYLLPSPAAAALVAGFIWLMTELGVRPGEDHWLTWSQVTWIMFAFTLYAGLTMVTNVPFYSFKDVQMKKSVPFAAIVLIALGIAVINIHPPIVLFGVFVFYGLSGYAVYAWRKAKGQHSSVISTSTDEPDERGLHK